MNILHDTQSLYVGLNWMIYAGPGGFDRSEMIAPALLLAEPGAALSCRIDGMPEITAACIRHPAGRWSSATSARFIIIYFDPLSPAGRAIQCCADQDLASVTSSIDKEYFHDLLGGAVSAQDVVACVEKIGQDLTKGIKLLDLDHRVIAVADKLAENSIGRLDLKVLSALTNTSGDRLRHLFKSQVHVTLSKYKIWRQLHSMTFHTLHKSKGNLDWATSSAIHLAGFYDDAHGYRTLSQYFGPRGSLTKHCLNLIDCTRFEQAGCNVELISARESVEEQVDRLFSRKS